MSNIVNVINAEEENFDKTGMKVIARYNNGDEEEIFIPEGVK